MINKEVTSVEEAIQGVDDNMTFMVGGFGLCGIPRISHYDMKGIRVEERENEKKHIYYNE